MSWQAGVTRYTPLATPSSHDAATAETTDGADDSDEAAVPTVRMEQATIHPRGLSGAWNDAEHRSFVSALLAHGDNEDAEAAWSAIAEEVNTREGDDVKLHAQAHFCAPMRVGLAREIRAALERCAEKYDELFERCRHEEMRRLHLKLTDEALPKAAAAAEADCAQAVALVDSKVCKAALAQLCERRSERPGACIPLRERFKWTFRAASGLIAVSFARIVFAEPFSLQLFFRMYAMIFLGAAILWLRAQSAERFPRVFGNIFDQVTPAIAKKIVAGECLYLKEYEDETEQGATQGSGDTSDASLDAGDPRCTRNDFLAAGLERCVPFTTAHENHRLTLKSFDWDSMLLHFSVLACATDHDGKVERQKIAEMLGADDFDVWPADIEDIARAIEIPPRVSSVDFLVLMTALALDVDDEPSMRTMIRRFAHKASKEEMVARHVVRVCNQSCKAKGVTGVEGEEQGQTQVQTEQLVDATVDAIEALSGLGEWRMHPSTIKLTSTRRAAIWSYLESSPVGQAAVVDTVLQLYYEQFVQNGLCRFPLEKNGIIARIQTARRHFEAIATDINQRAESYDLLDRTFGASALLDDELCNALTSLRDLDASFSGERLREVAAETVCFEAWAVFAIEVGIPTSQDEVCLLEKPQPILKARGGESLSTTWFDYVDVALGMPVGWWRLTAIVRRKESYCCGISTWIFFTLFFMAIVLPPWYWALFASDVSFWTGIEQGHLVRSDWDTNGDDRLNLTEFESPQQVADAELWEFFGWSLPEHNRTVWFAENGQPYFLGGEGPGMVMNETDYLEATYGQHEAVFDRVDRDDDDHIDWLEEQRMNIPLHVAVSPLALTMLLVIVIVSARPSLGSSPVSRRLNLSHITRASSTRDGHPQTELVETNGGASESDLIGRRRRLHTSVSRVPVRAAEAPPPDAEDLLVVVMNACNEQSKSGSILLHVFLMGVVEAAALMAYQTVAGVSVYGVETESVFVQHVPIYEKTNPETIYWMLQWSQFLQVFVVVLGAFVALKIGKDMRQRMTALERLVSAPAPRLSFRHAANVVAWCRLRDEVMLQSRMFKTILTGFVELSACWALLGGLAFGWLRLIGAPATRYYVTCGWYALVGGLVAVFQLAAAAGIDASIESHRLMLKVELINNVRATGTFDATDVEHTNIVSTGLRAASTVIEGELEAYDSNPESRFFYVLGFRVKTVLRTVGVLVASQAGTLFAAEDLSHFVTGNTTAVVQS